MIKEDDHKKSYQLIIYQKTSVKKLHFFQIISPFSFSTPNQTYELLGIHCVKIGGKMKMLSNPLFVLWGVLSSLYSNASCVWCVLCCQRWYYLWLRALRLGTLYATLMVQNESTLGLPHEWKKEVGNNCLYSLLHTGSFPDFSLLFRT